MSRKNSSRKASVEKVRKVSNERMSEEKPRKMSGGKNSAEKNNGKMSAEKSRKMSGEKSSPEKDRKMSAEKVRRMSAEQVRKLSSEKLRIASEKVKKEPTKYIISKKTPTQLTGKVSPVFDDFNVFVSCANTILVYSLQTGLHIRTLRSKPKDEKNKATGDVHKANIILLSIQDGNLLSICSQGTIAKWSTQDFGVLDFKKIG